MWLATLLFACGDPTPTHAGTCDPGGRVTYVISELTFARRDGRIVNGFDIDGSDEDVCGHDDLTAPDGIEGVDNNFSALVPILEQTEAVAAESLIAQSIASGELMITFEMDGLDSWDADDCVDFSLGRAEGVPLVAPDGVVLADQTLVPHSTIPTITVPGEVDEGRLVARGLRFNLPMDILNAELDFVVTDGSFWMQRRWDGAVTGVMGGQIPIAQITEILVRDDVNLQEFVPVVESFADIEGAEGDCDGLSLGFEFTAIPVYLTDG